MILPDVNLLIHAYNPGAPQHEAARGWWARTLTGTELVGLAWGTLLGFIRITTSRTVLRNPVSTDDALRRVEAWLAQPNVRTLHPTHQHAELLARFLRRARAAGNLTTDAHLAALAIEHGCTLCSSDTDFARFPGLSWHNPLA